MTNDGWSDIGPSAAAWASIGEIRSRLIEPAVLGFRCLHGSCAGQVRVSLYRSVQDDEDGRRCAEGTISGYDGEVHWFVKPPAGVLADGVVS